MISTDSGGSCCSPVRNGDRSAPSTGSGTGRPANPSRVGMTSMTLIGCLDPGALRHGPRIADDKRHLDCLVPRPLFLVETVRPVHVAMVRREHDDRVVRQSQFGNGVEETLELIVQKSCLGVIPPEVLSWDIGTIGPALDRVGDRTSPDTRPGPGDTDDAAGPTTGIGRTDCRRRGSGDTGWCRRSAPPHPNRPIAAGRPRYRCSRSGRSCARSWPPSNSQSPGGGGPVAPVQGGPGHRDAIFRYRRCRSRLA